MKDFTFAYVLLAILCLIGVKTGVTTYHPEWLGKEALEAEPLSTAQSPYLSIDPAMKWEAPFFPDSQESGQKIGL